MQKIASSQKKFIHKPSNFHYRHAQNLSFIDVHLQVFVISFAIAIRSDRRSLDVSGVVRETAFAG